LIYFYKFIELKKKKKGKKERKKENQF